MGQPVVIIGYGAIGQATADALLAAGHKVTVAQRTRPVRLAAGLSYRPCDVLDLSSVRTALDGAAQVVLAIGLPYDGKVWRATWPRAMTTVLEACAASAARLVFVDNLYMLGPQTEPLREDMPLSDQGVKPAVRSAVTRLWMAAAAAGRVRVASLRPPDFYGPGVALSHLGSAAFGALAKGATATLLVQPDILHDFAYVPDIARAVATLLDAPDDCFGQAWNMPCSPTRTPRDILRLGADALGRPLRLRTVPMALWRALGLVMPFLREANEMRFALDRPYHVDATKFTTRFWSDVTPIEIGAPRTARSFLPPDAARRIERDGRAQAGGPLSSP